MTAKRTPGQELGKVLEEVVFIPTPAMRRTKAAYLAATEENPLLAGQDPTVASVQQVTGDTRITKWWSTPGFRDWFSNRDEFRQRVEYLANLALDTIEDILLDSEANASARNSAAKLMIEAAGKLPKGTEKERYADEQISSMSKKELEQFIRRKAPQLLGDGEGN